MALSISRAHAGGEQSSSNLQAFLWCLLHPIGYNILVGPKFGKVYSEADVEIGTIIRSIITGRRINGNPAEVIQTLSCSY